MKTLHYLIAITSFSFLITSCATQHVYKGDPTYTNSKDEKSCSLHQQKLIADEGFAQSDEVCIYPTEDYLRWMHAFPNHNSDISKEKSEFYNNPIEFSYCPSCRRDLAKKLKN